MSEENIQAAPMPQIPGTAQITVQLTIDTINAWLKVLDDSNLPHQNVKRMANELLGQTLPQVNKLQEELMKQQATADSEPNLDKILAQDSKESDVSVERTVSEVKAKP